MPTVKLHDGTSVRLGYNRPKSRPQTLHLKHYVDLAAVQVPDTLDYTAKAADSIKHMYLNDTYGDCVIAGVGHAEGIWSGNKTGTPVIATDQEIYSAYQNIFGPGDNGCNIAAVLNYQTQHGITLGGVTRKIDGYVAVDWTNKDLVKAAVLIFGVIKVGFSLPNAWASSAPNVPWDLTRTRIVGGHDVEVVGYDETGVLISTWGSTRTWTWAAFCNQTWIDEAYVMLSPEWYGKDNVSPSGLDVATLKADLQKLGGGTIPPIDPVPPPTPNPPVVPPTPNPAPAPTLTLEQAIQAVKDGIKAANLGWFVTADKVQAAAIEGLQNAWPHVFREQSPLPGKVAEELLEVAR